MRLMERLPELIYNNEPHVLDLQDAIGTVFIELLGHRDDIMNQILPGRASWGLDRFEQEYAITPEAGISEAQRLARWRAKRRGRGTSTTEVIRAAAQSFFKEPVQIIEYPAEYRFAVQAFPNDDETLDWKGLSRALWGIKPAHLDHFYRAQVGAIADVSALGRFVRFDVQAGINAFGMKIVRLDGSWLLDGSWFLGAKFERGPHIPGYEIRFFENGRLRNQLSFYLRAHTSENALLKANQVHIQMSHNAFGLKWAYLSGAFPLDGSWILSAIFHLGPRLCVFAVWQRIPVMPANSTGMKFGDVRTRQKIAGAVSAAEVRTVIGASYPGKVIVGTRAEHPVKFGMTMQITMDTMYVLGGEVLLDGSRRLNADIITIDLL